MSLSTAEFLVGPLIGQGSFGQVICCQHKATDRIVAIKVVDKVSVRRRPHLRESILQEQRLLRSQLKNSVHIAELYASFHDDECLYMVMECCQGDTLQQLIDRYHLHQNWLPDAAHYGRQILNALQAIHSRQIIHADLSPSNILLTERGRIKLCDFGCAVDQAGTSQVFGEASTSNLVAESLARGTCDFASPEILRGVSSQDLTIAVDIWSFGCILWCLLKGEPPFASSSEALAVQKVLTYANQTGEDRQALISNANLPQAWQRLIGPMLEPDQRLRFGDDDNQRREKDWHARLMKHELWAGLDMTKDPHLLPVIPEWLTSFHNGEVKDGSKGWSAFHF